MSYISFEELSSHNDSYHKLVLLAAERANQLLEGARPLIQVGSIKKPTTIALMEIARNKVRIKNANTN